MTLKHLFLLFFFPFLANPIDKNIRLAPNKSVFSSPSYGKRTEDGKSSQSTQQHHSNRHRHNVCIGGKMADRKYLSKKETLERAKELQFSCMTRD